MERDLGADVRERAGAGAAGGLGAGLMALLDAELRAGVDIVLDAVGLAEQLDGADLVITGEGQIDASTIFNKAPVGVARLASQRGIPVIALSGSLGEGYEGVHELGIDAVFTLVDRPMTLDDALADTNRRSRARLAPPPPNWPRKPPETRLRGRFQTARARCASPLPHQHHVDLDRAVDPSTITPSMSPVRLGPVIRFIELARVRSPAPRSPVETIRPATAGLSLV